MFRLINSRYRNKQVMENLHLMIKAESKLKIIVQKRQLVAWRRKERNKILSKYQMLLSSRNKVRVRCFKTLILKNRKNRSRKWLQLRNKIKWWSLLIKTLIKIFYQLIKLMSRRKMINFVTFSVSYRRNFKKKRKLKKVMKVLRNLMLIQMHQRKCFIQKTRLILTK